MRDKTKRKALTPKEFHEPEKVLRGNGFSKTQVKSLGIQNWREEPDIIGPLIAGSFLAVLFPSIGWLSETPLMVLLTPAIGLGSIVAAAINSIDVRERKVKEALLAEGQSPEDYLGRSQAERKLTKTFHIKENTEFEITKWVDSTNSVEEKDASHTIHQYLRRTKKGYQLEQDVTPNEETIWDLSADALVEVYGVQEVKSVEA